MHFMLSPVLFVVVYMGYGLSGSRKVSRLGLVSWLVIILVNIGLPLLRAFYVEVFLVGWGIMFLVGYFVGLV